MRNKDGLSSSLQQRNYLFFVLYPLPLGVRTPYQRLVEVRSRLHARPLRRCDEPGLYVEHVGFNTSGRLYIEVSRNGSCPKGGVTRCSGFRSRLVCPVAPPLVSGRRRVDGLFRGGRPRGSRGWGSRCGPTRTRTWDRPIMSRML